MKKLLFAILVLTLVVSFTSCRDKKVWGIKRSDLFIAHANDIKCFVIQ